MKQIIAWLLQGDVSIQYQTKRDLLEEDDSTLQNRIASEGWGLKFLSERNANGHWGQKFYQPKWISTHYTVLDLKNLSISPQNPIINETLELILREEKGIDGGIRPIGSVQKSDVCINGMFLNYAAYFGAREDDLRSIVDFLLSELMPDGGFNCRSNRSGARHSSMHTTISVIEGITEYQSNGYRYRLNELSQAKNSSIEFLLCHNLFRSDRTGEIIHRDFLRLSYPSRWRYDILRALDQFQSSDIPYDERMSEALDVIERKRNKNGTWNVQAKHPGKVHFDMEKAGKPSRWNTLRALRVMRSYRSELADTT